MIMGCVPHRSKEPTGQLPLPDCHRELIYEKQKRIDAGLIGERVSNELIMVPGSSHMYTLAVQDVTVFFAFFSRAVSAPISIQSFTGTSVSFPFSSALIFA